MTISKRQAARNDAIYSGVENAVDTVVSDKAMTAGEAYRRLKHFVDDGLSCYGFDEATPAEMIFAKRLWPLACEDADQLESVKGSM